MSIPPVSAIGQFHGAWGATYGNTPMDLTHGPAAGEGTIVQGRVRGVIDSLNQANPGTTAGNFGSRQTN